MVCTYRGCFRCGEEIGSCNSIHKYSTVTNTMCHIILENGFMTVSMSYSWKNCYNGVLIKLMDEQVLAS